MEHKISLLCTASLEPQSIMSAKAEGITLDVVSFIQTIDISDYSGTQEKILDIFEQRTTIVFTSSNAVRAVCENPAFDKPNWDIYCIGGTTQTAVLNYFTQNNIKGSASDAELLAEIIINAAPSRKIYFFCGAARMETLAVKLTAAGIKISEIVVYTTVETSAFIEKDYDGILFCSPSAVRSFFNLNRPLAETVLFAIGQTTARAIKNETDNKIVVSDKPSKEHLLEIAVNYLKNINKK
ncbi:MAG: uroporphyrinogen-III synthase [Taibaiella sp.]|nr:uroporphyrinogen-III synthase [Taibaiella sp.]